MGRASSRVRKSSDVEASAGALLAVNVPVRGYTIDMDRPVQVQPNAEMEVSFEATPETPPRLKRSLLWAGGLFVLVLALLAADARARRTTA